MFRHALGIVALCLLSGPVGAHEFWIEPQAMTLAAGDALRPVVKIGTDFKGTSHPFEPRAYRRIIWTAPRGNTEEASDTEPLQFTKLAPGLHILGVESNSQVLSYDRVADFVAYIGEIGLTDRVDTTEPELFPGGPIIERYRRFSKTLVHFGDPAGSDRPIGLTYEWVRRSDGFLLLANSAPQPEHPVFLFCRDTNGAVAELQSYQTDPQGRINPEIEGQQTCLLNATFITRQEDKSWFSSWTSILFRP